MPEKTLTEQAVKVSLPICGEFIEVPRDQFRRCFVQSYIHCAQVHRDKNKRPPGLSDQMIAKIDRESEESIQAGAVAFADRMIAGVEQEFGEKTKGGAASFAEAPMSRPVTVTHYFSGVIYNLADAAYQTERGLGLHLPSVPEELIKSLRDLLAWIPTAGDRLTQRPKRF